MSSITRKDTSQGRLPEIRQHCQRLFCIL